MKKEGDTLIWDSDDAFFAWLKENTIPMDKATQLTGQIGTIKGMPFIISGDLDNDRKEKN